MIYDVCLQITSMLLIGLTIFMYYTRKRIDFDSNRFYGVMLWCVEAELLVDIICELVKAKSGALMNTALAFWSKLYFFSVALCCVMLLTYALLVVFPDGKQRKNRLIYYWVTMTVSGVCLAIFPVQLVVSGSRTYTESIGMLVALVFCFHYVVSSLYYAIRYRKKLQGKFAGIVAFSLLALISILMQLILKSHMIIGIAGSISLIYLFFTFENPDALADPSTGLYHRRTYHLALDKLFNKKKNFVVIAVRIVNFKTIVDTFQVETCLEAENMLGTFISHASGGKAFRYMDYGFTIIVNDVDEAKVIMDRIRGRFAETWPVGGEQIKLDICGCYLECPKSASNMNTMYEIIRYGITMALKERRMDFLCVDENVVSQVARMAKIEKAIYHAIEHGGFEVYYQPIYSVQENNFATAEALLRLNDPKLGFIPPDEFIPIAEENGSIIKIGIIVMEKVCQFITQNDLEKMGIRFVEVNLSLVQCMQDDLSDQLVRIMQKYKVNPGLINLELTETAAVKSAEKLLNNMQSLISAGSGFSLDDYGTGYSNINYIVSLPFHIIKLDKSMVWAYEGNDKARVVMDHVIGMIKQLKFSIIGEGVETKEQARNLIDQGVDYLQGYYFSKPLPEDKYLEFLKQPNKDWDL